MLVELPKQNNVNSTKYSWTRSRILWYNKANILTLSVRCVKGAHKLICRRELPLRLALPHPSG